MDETTIPEGALSRDDIIVLVTSFQAVAYAGCSCDVRFIVRRCECPEAHAVVETFHADDCRSRKITAAPFN